MVNYQRKNCSSYDQYFNSKTIHVIADGATVSDEDQVDVGHATEDEEDLDTSVV